MCEDSSRSPILSMTRFQASYRSFRPLLSTMFQNSQVPFRLQFFLETNSSSRALVNCRELCMTMLSALIGMKM